MASYTTNIKNEIAIKEETRSELIAEMSAFVRNNGYLDNNTLFLTTENSLIKNKIIKAFEELYEVEVNVEIKGFQ